MSNTNTHATNAHDGAPHATDLRNTDVHTADLHTAARRRLGRSALEVGPICLGTMTFGEQVGEADAFAILDRAIERGIDFIDTAEMYPVPPSATTFSATESIIGRWMQARKGVRERLVLATKVAGPSRGMPWIRDGAPDLKPEHIRAACDASLKRLKTDVIDLYQFHWPNRSVSALGRLDYVPNERDAHQTNLRAQLEAMDELIRAGKVRAIGLSNETPWGVMECVRLSEAHGLPRIATLQNPYCLVNRWLENGLDEITHREQIAQIPYSPLGFGLLTGKYDARGFIDPDNNGRIARYERTRGQRWGRPDALAAARRYNALAREHGLSPTQMALSWVCSNWRVASTIIGVTSVAQLDEQLDGWNTPLSNEVLAAIDRIRWEIRDPAQ